MSLGMLEALHAAFDRARNDEAVVVLSSARPGIFSAGFDLKVFWARDAKASHTMVKAGAELALKILQHPLSHAVARAADMRFRWGRFSCWHPTCGLRRRGLSHRFERGGDRDSRAQLCAGAGPAELHPAWLNRGTLTGEMFLPEDAVTAGFFDKVVAADEFERTVAFTAQQMKQIHLPLMRSPSRGCGRRR